MRLQVNAFIATLGSGGVFVGLSAVYSDGPCSADTLIVTVSQRLVNGGVPFTWNDVVNGLVLIGAVSFQSYFTGTRRRSIRGRRLSRSGVSDP